MPSKQKKASKSSAIGQSCPATISADQILSFLVSNLNKDREAMIKIVGLEDPRYWSGQFSKPFTRVTGEFCNLFVAELNGKLFPFWFGDDRALVTRGDLACLVDNPPSCKNPLLFSGFWNSRENPKTLQEVYLKFSSNNLTLFSDLTKYVTEGIERVVGESQGPRWKCCCLLKTEHFYARGENNGKQKPLKFPDNACTNIQVAVSFLQIIRSDSQHYQTIAVPCAFPCCDKGKVIDNDAEWHDSTRCVLSLINGRCKNRDSRYHVDCMSPAELLDDLEWEYLLVCQRCQQGVYGAEVELNEQGFRAVAMLAREDCVSSSEELQDVKGPQRAVLVSESSDLLKDGCVVIWDNGSPSIIPYSAVFSLQGGHLVGVEEWARLLEASETMQRASLIGRRGLRLKRVTEG